MSQLVDQFGQPIKALKRPETRELAVTGIRDRWSSYPSAGLTPQRLAAIFRAADWGDLRAQAELFEDMEEKDAHLASVMQTRRLAVLGLDWQIDPSSESAEDKRIADFCREQLEALELEDLLANLVGAIGYGYSAVELLWENQGQATISGIKPIHPKNISWVNSEVPLVITEDNFQGTKPSPWKIVYHRYAVRSGHDTRNGVLRVCAYMYLFKNYALKDWATFNEVFGMPLRLGKYEPSATPADREALRAAISSLGSDAAGIISKSTEIEFIEMVSRGTANPYQVMALFCNREMSKAVLGQTLTTDTEGSTGTYAAGLIQEEVRRDLLEADARALGKTIRGQLLRPLVGFNFGWDKPLPQFSLLVQETLDLKADAEMAKNLAEIGLPIPISHLYAHFGIPEPQNGEAVIGGLTGLPPGQVEGSKAVLPLRDGGELILDQRDGQVIRVQRELDNLTQSTLEASAQAAVQMLAPVRDSIEAGGSLEEIRDKLLAAYGQMATEDLEEALYQAMILANLRGRLE